MRDACIEVLQKATTPSALLVRPRSTLQGLQGLQGCRAVRTAGKGGGGGQVKSLYRQERKGATLYFPGSHFSQLSVPLGPSNPAIQWQSSMVARPDRDVVLSGHPKHAVPTNVEICD